MPLPPDLRARLKMLADGLGQRIAQAVASLLVLAAVSVGLGTHALGWGLFAFAAAWLGVTVGVRRSYVGVFRQQMLRGKLEPYAPAPFDLQSIESLVAALNSSDDLRVVATLETLAESGKVSLIPALILFHPSQEVVLRALELFDGQGGPITWRSPSGSSSIAARPCARPSSARAQRRWPTPPSSAA